jgi:hypothetical protein
MKNLVRSLFIITCSFVATVAAAAAQGTINTTLKVQVVEQNYKLDSYTLSNGTTHPAQDIKIQVQFAKPSTLAELEKAKEWLRTAEDKYRIEDQNRYTINIGQENLALTAPQLFSAGERQEISVPLSRLQKIRNWLSSKTGLIKSTEKTQADISTPAQRSKIKEGLDNFIYKFSSDKLRVPLINGKSIKLNYLPTLAIVRGTVNGTVISLSFLASDLSPNAALAVGYGLGLSSGLIQYFIEPISNWMVREGNTHSIYKKALAKAMYAATFFSSYRAGISAELAKEMATTAQEDFMKLNFTESALKNASLITKWWAVEVVILGTADLAFRYLLNAPLTPDLTSGIMSVLYTSSLATLGQGTWDFAFIIDNEKRKEALSERREALILADQLTSEASEEIDRGFAKVKFGLASKAFAISVTSNIAAALLLADSASMTTIANTAMGTLSVAGASYYGYMQVKYNEGIRAKISKFKSSILQRCEDLLGGTAPLHP